jgi:hypothetical protein
MPIEIRELVVRTVVSDDAPAPSPVGSGMRGDVPAPASLPFDQLVQECVRQVLLALARDRDR